MYRYTVATFTARWYTYPSEKSEFISWDDYSQYIMENKTCSKAHQPVWKYYSSSLYDIYIFTVQYMSSGYMTYHGCAPSPSWSLKRSYRIWNGGTPHSWMVDFMENP